MAYNPANRLGRVPIPSIHIKAVGNWARAERIITTLPSKVMNAARWGQRKAAQRLVKIVKGHMDAQDLGWAPKKNPGLSNDSRSLFDHGTYRANIKTWQKGGQRYIGVKKNVVNSRGIPIYRIAALLEHGSKNFPARPLWEPSVREMGGKPGFKNIIAIAINNKLKLIR